VRRSVASGAGVGRRLTIAALLAAGLVVGACGGAKDTADDATAASDAAGAAAGEDPAAASIAVPVAPSSVEDSIRLHEDSLYELRNLTTRQASMESYASCMVKARHSDPQTRPVLEAVCQRARGAPVPARPR